MQKKIISLIIPCFNEEQNVAHAHSHITKFWKTLKYDFDYDNILLVSEFLQNITIQHCDFQDSLNNVRENDLVFLDPPYTIAHNLRLYAE